MKIVILADLPSIHTKVWVNYLEKKGHNICVITFRPDITYQGRYFYIDSHAPGKLKYLTKALQIRKIVRTENPDLVMGCFLTSYGFLAAFTGVKPLILRTQGSDILVGSKKFLLKPFVKYALRRADLVMCGTSQIKKRLVEKLGCPEEKIITKSYGVDTELFSPGKQEKGLVISTRPFEPIYNVQLLAKAIPLVRDPDVHFKFIGSGSQQRKIDNMIASVKDKIKLYYSMPQYQLAKLLKKAQIYVSVSLSDGECHSTLEAMACGVFPILSDIPRNRELVSDGINGFLVPVDNPKILANRIDRALGDVELRQRVASYNVTLVRTLHSRRNMNEIWEKIKEVVR